MNFIDKVKNFFYEDEEVEITESPVSKKVIENKPHIEKKKTEKESFHEISEKELFESERTFNFPMDLDENIFDKEEIKEKQDENLRNNYFKGQVKKNNTIINSYKKEEKKEEKKFKPTPVISPVYGILNKDYNINDVENLSRTKEFSFEKKIVDYDSVRNKAYKDLDDEIEKTFTKNRDIFYNLDEEENNNIEQDDELKDVVITYNLDEENNIEKEENDENAELTRTKKNKDKTTNIENDDEDDNDNDLFSLIDNMYRSEDEEENEEE